MIRRVTADILLKAGACKDQVEIFAHEWPDGTRLTKKACLRAAELELDIDWYANNFLTATAWVEYEKAIATAWAKYRKAATPAWAKYGKAEAIALYESDKGGP